MKTSFILLCLALFVAAVFADCDPNSNGMPTCTAGMNGMNYRNFWDPTRYWQCQGNVAVTEECTFGGFLESKNRCVSWDEWTWTPPCPSTS